MSSLPFPMIDPIAVSIGPIDIRWYALAYLAGFIGGWQLSMRLAGWNEAHKTPPTVKDLDDVIIWVVIGVILGGRLGYILFYNFDFYLNHPELILQIWNGGMAFHGGLIGVILAMVIFAARRNIPFFALSDIAAMVTPIGLFFGRMANFINAELIGRPSDLPIAFIFPGTDGQPRHASQLYEAVFEGLVLFTIMMLMGRNDRIRASYGMISGAFLSFYALFRFLIEFTREPDPQIGLYFDCLTQGQLLCIPMFLLGEFLILRAMMKNGMLGKQD